MTPARHGTAEVAKGRVNATIVVGRAPELAALDEALGRAAAGDSRLLVVDGEAGIGKTAFGR